MSKKKFIEKNISDKANKEIAEEHKVQLDRTLKNISTGKTNFRNWNDVKNFFNVS